MDITRDVMAGVQVGKTPAQIRTALDGKYGTRHATPTPWPPGR
jgi:hypothetical protein